MGIWDGIAAVGLAGRGYEDMDSTIRTRERENQQKKVQDLMVNEALRKDELASGLRKAISGVTPRAAAAGIDSNVQVDTPDDQPYIDTVKGFGAAADQNVQAKMQAGAAFAGSQGEMELEEKYRQAYDKMKTEGFGKIVAGVAQGKTPKEIADEFNTIGQKRIVGGAVTGDRYKFKYEDGSEAEYSRPQMADLGARMGLLKKNEAKVVPQYSSLVDPETREVIFSGDKRPPPRIDPYSPAGIAAKKELLTVAGETTLKNKKDFESWKANTFDAKDPAKIRELNSLVQDFGLSQDEAMQLAYHSGKGAKSFEDSVLRWAQVLKSDPDLMDANKLLARARELASTFAAQKAATPKAAPAAVASGPEQLSGPGVTTPEGKSVKAPPVDTGRRTKAGKRIFKDAAGNLLVED